MGFFKKRSNRRPKYLDQELPVVEAKVYASFERALNENLTSGSLDLKRTNIKNENKSFWIYSIDGKLRSVFKAGLDFDLKKRLMWEPEGAEELISISGDQDIYRYHEYIEKAPHLKDILSEIYFNFHISVAKELDVDLRAGVPYLITTETLYSTDLEGAVKEWDFFDSDSKSISLLIEADGLRYNGALSRMGLNPSIKNVQISLLSAEYKAKNGNEAVILKVASEWPSYSSLHDYIYLGFAKSTLFETLERLSLQGVVGLVGVKKKFDEALPMISEELLLSSPVETVEKLNSEENIEESDFGLDDDDDLDADIIEKNIDPLPEGVPRGQGALKFIATEGLDDDITGDFEEIFNNDTNQKMGDEILDHLISNMMNEDKIHEIEKELKSLTDDYLHNAKKYGEMKLDKVFTDIDKENEDLSERQAETVETDLAMARERDFSNEVFFQIQELEKQRHDRNEERRDILYNLLEYIDSYQDETKVQELQKRVEIKIQGIYDVENVALHINQSEELEIITPVSNGSKFDQDV